MSEPFIYIGTWTIKEGMVEEAKKRLAEVIDFVETNEPRVIAFHAFLDEAGKTCTVMHVHPDSASMELHMQLNVKHFATAFDWMGETVREQYYGKMSEALAAELAKWGEPESILTRMPVHEGGFARTSVR